MSTERHGALRLLRNRDVARLLGAQLLSTLTFGVVAAALGWQAYERTGSALTLGLIGLAEFLPALIFALPAGPGSACAPAHYHPMMQA